MLPDVTGSVFSRPAENEESPGALYNSNGAFITGRKNVNADITTIVLETPHFPKADLFQMVLSRGNSIYSGTDVIPNSIKVKLFIKY